VYLAYLDDSDTKAKTRKFQVVSAVILKDTAFKLAGIGMSAVSEVLMGEVNCDRFKEFHACELYGGYKTFEGINQELRFSAIKYLLGMLTKMEMAVVYGSVDLEVLKKDVYGSADPVDVCFRQCIAGIESWASDRAQSDVAVELWNEADQDNEKINKLLFESMINKLVILIADECDGKTKNTLQQSFRHLRTSPRQLDTCFHDDMYFGDSRYSIGIQLADLCSYFIARHLEGDTEIEGFYKMIEPRIYRQQSALSNLEGLKELADGQKNESELPDIRESNGDNSPRRSEGSENRDGLGETGTSDGSGTNGKARTGPTA